MSQVRSNDPSPRLGQTGDEQSSAARLRRAQHRAQRDYLLEEMQSDLLHFSSTIQRLQDHFRASPQTTDIALTRTLESTQAIFTALETAYNHLFVLRNTLRSRSPSLPQSLSPLQTPPLSTPTPVLPTLFPENRTLSPSTGPSSYTSLATNGWQETVHPPMTETSPAEERAAHYVALSPSDRSISPGIRVNYSARRSHADDADVPTELEAQRQSEAQDDPLWYSIPSPPPPSSDRPQPALPPRFNLGRARLRTQRQSTTPQHAPSSVVQFMRQSQTSVSTISSTSSSSSPISSSSASSSDTNDDPNTGGGDGGSTGNDDLMSVNRAANRLFQRLTNPQETTRRLRWPNSPGLADGQTLTTADIDPFPPTAPARRPDVYANLLRRHALSTAPPPNAGPDAGMEEENKENVEGELVLCHTMWGEG
jgi:hypothetical protein